MSLLHESDLNRRLRVGFLPHFLLCLLIVEEVEVIVDLGEAYAVVQNNVPLFGTTLWQDECKGEVLVGFLVVAISIHDVILHPKAVVDEGQDLRQEEIARNLIALVVHFPCFIIFG